MVWYLKIMRGLTRRGVVMVALLCGSFSSCNGHLNKEGYFKKGNLQYHVATPDPAQWEQVKFAENDLAWVNKKSAHVLSVNATCDDHGDPGLDVLTTHLLFGFTDRTLKTRETKMVDGREALLSNYVAKLDGVPVEIDLAVLKKNDCVHDFIYVSPLGQAQEHRGEFDRILAEFKAERG
jgi:hypothetical protein